MNSSEAELSQDVVFDILSSPRRRYVLYYLRDTGEAMKLTDLAEQVAAWENDTEPEDITDKERKRVYVSLYQTHIPRLEEAGIIAYDQDSGTVALANEASDIDQYLDSSNGEFSWQVLYLAIATTGVILLGLATLDVAMFAEISESLMAGVIILGFAITALVHSIARMLDRRSVPPELRE